MDRTCMECGAPLVGRADKKFCDDQCRTSYHNRIYREDSEFIRNVQSILKRNRKILADYHTHDGITIPVNELKLNGYNFDFYTNTWTPMSGSTYFFCYDYGFARISGDTCVVIKRTLKEDEQ